MDWEQLRDFIGADDSDQAKLTEDAATAVLLVDNYIGTGVTVPPSIKLRAYQATGQALWDQRSARGGFLQEQFPGQDGAAWGPVRVARDPMANAYKILAGWVNPW